MFSSVSVTGRVLVGGSAVQLLLVTGLIWSP
jgi:hypothetical protein